MSEIRNDKLTVGALFLIIFGILVSVCGWLLADLAARNKESIAELAARNKDSITELRRDRDQDRKDMGAEIRAIESWRDKNEPKIDFCKEKIVYFDGLAEDRGKRLAAVEFDLEKIKEDQKAIATRLGKVEGILDERAAQQQQQQKKR
jgi:hypothetical protein